MYRLNYQYNHDIDWFCRINGLPVHLASNGGVLPGRSYTIKNLVALQHKVANMKQTFRCAVNSDYLLEYLKQGKYYAELENISEAGVRSLLPESFEIANEVAKLSSTLLIYGWSFIEMAKRGFFSFDRREEDGLYHLVAWPADFDKQSFEKDVYDSLTEYEGSYLPSCHVNYNTSLPDSIKFYEDSLQPFYHK